MSYEIFEKSGRRITGKETVSILKQGVLGLGGATVVKHFEGKRYATLHYDRAAGKIGIRPEAKETPNTYELRGLEKKRGGVQISAQAFLRHFEIPHEKTKAYSCKWNEAEKLVEFELEK